MMGTKIPPARAEVEGMAGAINASATLRPYDKPSVFFPNAFTNIVAMRSPRPVFSNPLAKKNDTTISQMISLVIAEKACWNDSVLVASVTVTAINAQAPTGRGSRTNPRMVETKIANRLQPYRLTYTVRITLRILGLHSLSMSPHHYMLRPGNKTRCNHWVSAKTITLLKLSYFTIVGPARSA
jgi:hypothetical protein